MSSSSYLKADIPRELIPIGTLTPDDVRCTSQVSVGPTVFRCGAASGHPGPHAANLKGDIETFAGLLQWSDRG